MCSEEYEIIKVTFHLFAYKMYLFHFQILFFKKIVWKSLYSAHESLSHNTFSQTLRKLPTEYLCEIMDTSVKQKGGQMK